MKSLFHALGGFLAITLVGCSALPPLVEKPTLKVEHFSLEKINKREAEFILTVSVKNPNAFSLTLQSVKAELAIASVVIAEGHSETAMTLPSHEALPVQLKVHSDLKNASQIIAEMIINPNKKLPYHLTGQVRLTQLSLAQDFDQKGEESLLSWFSHKNTASSP